MFYVSTTFYSIRLRDFFSENIPTFAGLLLRSANRLDKSKYYLDRARSAQEARTEIDKRSRKTHTVNRINRLS